MELITYSSIISALIWVTKITITKILDIITIRIASTSNVKELETHKIKVKFK